MKKGITVAGSLILDKHFSMNSFPEKSTLSTIDIGEVSVGGCGNLILDLAKLDDLLPIKVCGMIGDGNDGKKILDTFDNYPNIDTTTVVKKFNTSITLVMDAEDDKSRTFFYYPGSSDKFSYDDICWGKINSDIFQLEYLLLLGKMDALDDEYGTVAAKTLHEAKSRGCLTSVDVVSEKGPRAAKLVPYSLKYTDYCTINEIEAQEITGIKIIENGEIDDLKILEALKVLKNMGVSTWVIIHNSKNCFGLDCKTDEIYKVASIDIPRDLIVGTTGAGDAFCSGILYSLYNSKPILEALKFASATAGCSLFAKDGSSGLCDFKNVWKIYEKYKNEVEYEKI